MAWFKDRAGMRYAIMKKPGRYRKNPERTQNEFVSFAGLFLQYYLQKHFTMYYYYILYNIL